MSWFKSEESWSKLGESVLFVDVAPANAAHRLLKPQPKRVSEIASGVLKVRLPSSSALDRVFNDHVEALRSCEPIADE